jgi:hypothetical protein
MTTFAVIAEHPPDLCPTSNAQTRQMLKDGAAQIPKLAERLGVDIVTLRIFGPDHIVLAVVEANDIEAVRNFILHSRLIQWNTTKIHATYSMEEAVAKSDAWRRSSKRALPRGWCELAVDTNPGRVPDEDVDEQHHASPSAASTELRPIL